MISRQQLEKFKKLYRQRYGVELDDKMARERAIAVAEMVRIIRLPRIRDAPDKKDRRLPNP